MRSAMTFVDSEERSARESDVLGDDGEPAALLSSASRFDGGVKREEVRLGGDFVDSLNDIADLLTVLTELIDRCRGPLHGFSDGIHGLDGLLNGGLAVEGGAAAVLSGSGRHLHWRWRRRRCARQLPRLRAGWPRRSQLQTARDAATLLGTGSEPLDVSG